MLQDSVSRIGYDAVVGFSKMPGLDLYFAADSCFAAKSEHRSFLYRLTGRYRHYAKLEKAVFQQEATTRIMMLSRLEKDIYQSWYGTQEQRFYLLPPGISRDRLRPPNAAEIRNHLRKELGINQSDAVVLMVGSGFKTKGADRALRAVASLPESLLNKTKFIAVGKDDFRPFFKLASRLGILKKVLFFAGRPDITRFLVASDILIHPAYKENTGTVLIEAMAAQLPVLASDTCGYSEHVSRADAGLIVPSPFDQGVLNQYLKTILTSPRRNEWMQNGGRYVAQNDVFSMPEKAADIIEQVASC